MTSPLNFFAKKTAISDLPTAVGPTITNIFGFDISYKKYNLIYRMSNSNSIVFSIFLAIVLSAIIISFCNNIELNKNFIIDKFSKFVFYKTYIYLRIVSPKRFFTNLSHQIVVRRKDDLILLSDFIRVFGRE